MSRIQAFLAIPCILSLSASDPSSSQQQILRAQYAWGYSGFDGQGKGDLSLLIEPQNGRLIAEIHGMGERLAMIEGNKAQGYNLQIPRQSIDKKGLSFSDLPLPLLSRLGDVDGLYRFLQCGVFEGVKVTRKDAQGPLKMRYRGYDDKKREYMVWLERTRFERGNNKL